MDRDLKRARTLISLVHDGQLTDEEYRFLEKAVLRYPELKLEIYRHERLHDLVDMIASVPAPPDIEDRVLKAIKSEGPVKRAAHVIFFPGRRFGIEAVGAIAASIIVFFVALISFPSLVGMDPKTAVLPYDTFGISTASVVMDEAPPAATEETRSPAEDVALVPRTTEDKKSDHLLYAGAEEKLVAAPEIDKGTFSSEIPSFGVLTASGVTAERVSKTFTPPRDMPLSTAKKEMPMESTTYIYSPTDELLLPTILLIYNSDPIKTKKDIMDKAVSLGGTVLSKEMEGSEVAGDKDKNVPGSYVKYSEKGAQDDAISLPPEKMDELLDYLVARYPETDKVIEDLKNRKTTPFLRIDVVPTIQ
ncbi:MAG: hypothetical protein JW765_13125 [Deltaproteobacteria bacterium]|nr:hypothetical protein [Candidatus Zymogenaceae bacterium]